MSMPLCVYIIHVGVGLRGREVLFLLMGGLGGGVRNVLTCVYVC